MRITAGFFASFALLSTWTQPLPARDIFVNNVAGDDRAIGASADVIGGVNGPVRTINKAVRLAEYGDHIIIADTGSPYRETVSLTGEHLSGSANEPFIIDGGGAILDGSLPVPSDAWQHYQAGIFRFRPDRLGHQQLFLNDRPAVRRPIATLDYTLPELEPLEWCLSGGWIYFRAELGRVPQDYQVSYAALQTGVTLYKVHDVLIGNLIVQGFQLDGVNAHDGAFDCRLSGMNCRGNGRSGFSVGGASRVLIEGAIAGENGAAQLRTEGYSHTHVEDCELLDASAPPYVRTGGELFIDGEAVKGERAEEAET